MYLRHGNVSASLQKSTKSFGKQRVTPRGKVEHTENYFLPESSLFAPTNRTKNVRVDSLRKPGPRKPNEFDMTILKHQDKPKLYAKCHRDKSSDTLLKVGQIIANLTL